MNLFLNAIHEVITLSTWFQHVMRQGGHVLS